MLSHHMQPSGHDDKPHDRNLDLVDRGPGFDPGSPIPTRRAEVRAAVMSGAIKAEDRMVAEAVLSRMQPDRNRNWHTVRPFTTGEIAAATHLKPRQVELSMARLRKAFSWWRGRRTEGGNVYRMGPDGVMVGSSLPHSRAFTRDAKKVAKEEAISKEPTSNSLSEDRGTDDVPLADLLKRWRVALPEEIVLFGLGLGLPRRLVLAAADRFVEYYTAHPERMRGDPTQMFCSQIWLPRDAARFVAKHGVIVDQVHVRSDLAVVSNDDEKTAPGPSTVPLPSEKQTRGLIDRFTQATPLRKPWEFVDTRPSDAGWFDLRDQGGEDPFGTFNNGDGGFGDVRSFDFGVPDDDDLGDRGRGWQRSCTWETTVETAS